ncbi:MAG TPA: hypothetical protein VLF66_13305 [Thermoanaerobaculia bacterium]|nr:hypothetical protein [Thermoanaerobaculia bacterium]
MNVLYVVSGGRVHLGRLEDDDLAGLVSLRDRAGRRIPPREVSCLLALSQTIDDERGMLYRAVQTGYDVQRV